MKFAYSDYSALVSEIVRCGYNITNYDNYKNCKKPCIMRHDVDFNLKKAAEFARYEADLGVAATYFILLSTDFYNVFSKEGREYIKKIESCGHTVGLHFDEMQYDLGGDVDLITEKICYEARIMSLLTEKPVRCVSMHRPSEKLLEENLAIPGIINSYSDEFFLSFKYISDSRMNWREDPMQVIDSDQYQSLHILTHPFWYGGTNLPEHLKEYILSANLERYDMLNQNFRQLGNEVDREEIRNK